MTRDDITAADTVEIPRIRMELLPVTHAKHTIRRYPHRGNQPHTQHQRFPLAARLIDAIRAAGRSRVASNREILRASFALARAEQALGVQIVERTPVHESIEE